MVYPVVKMRPHSAVQPHKPITRNPTGSRLKMTYRIDVKEINSFTLII